MYTSISDPEIAHAPPPPIFATISISDTYKIKIDIQ